MIDHDIDRDDIVLLTQDYEGVKANAIGLVTHLHGDPAEYPGDTKYNGLPGDVWVNFGANGGELWVEFCDLEVLQLTEEETRAIVQAILIRPLHADSTDIDDPRLMKWYRQREARQPEQYRAWLERRDKRSIV